MKIMNVSSSLTLVKEEAKGKQNNQTKKLQN